MLFASLMIFPRKGKGKTGKVVPVLN